ncbi:MAG: radical SAM protein [Planctomycetota bacterium]|jgi:uncharacterized protein
MISKEPSADDAREEDPSPFIKRFRTDEGYYVYDVNSNRILQVDRAMYRVLEDCPTLSPAELVKMNNHEIDPREAFDALEKIKRLQEDHDLFSSSRPKRMNHGLCDEHFLWHIDNALGQMILEVTTQCNLRCRYCVFSGSYEYTRSHGASEMPRKTAFKALDYFLAHSKKAEHQSVGFYGGEPLLNMPLIKECVDYVRMKAPDRKVMFHMTTNGTLLTEEAEEFLIENDVGFMVSLDGPKEVHDRNRVFPDGRGTFDTILSNLKRFWEMNPEWCEQRISTTCVLTDSCGPRRPYRFFGHPDNRRLCGMFIQASSVDSVNRIRDDLPPADVNVAQESAELYVTFLKKLVRNDLDVREEDFLKSNFQHTFLKLYKRQESPLGDRVSINGMCVPGWRKVFVDVSGAIHPCERVNRSFPIGHVDGNLDKDAVKQVLQMQVEANENRCLNCWAVRLCGACLASLNGDAAIDLEARDRYCETERSQWERALAHYTGILEMNPTAFDYMEKIVIS